MIHLVLVAKGVIVNLKNCLQDFLGRNFVESVGVLNDGKLWEYLKKEVESIHRQGNKPSGKNRQNPDCSDCCHVGSDCNNSQT